MYYRKGRGKAIVQSLFDLNAGITGLSVQQHLMREKYINQKTSGAESNRQSKSHSQLTNTVRNTEKKYYDESKSKPISKRKYTDLYVKANNNTDPKINRELKSINERWAKEFEGYNNWSDSPKFAAYEQEATALYNKLMSEEMEKLLK